MILLLDTSTPECRLTLVDSNNERFEYNWDAGRTLAHGLLGFIHDKLSEHGQSFDDLTAIGVMKGPGSFTGLRIGLTVLNTLASDRHVPIVGVENQENWRDAAIRRLSDGHNDKLILPEYGSAANITKQRK